MLLDIFLKSTAVPGYMVASFIKRLARLALSFSPAPASISVLALIHNLFVRHPGLSMMMTEARKRKNTKNDLFKDCEDDPNKTLAMQSYLWEIETLKSHYSPGVSQLAGTITKLVAKIERRKQGTVPAKEAPIMEIEFDSLTTTSYDGMFKEDFRKRKKLRKIPIAYYSEPPSGIWTQIEGEDWSGFHMSSSKESQ